MEKIQNLTSYQEDIYTCNRTRCGFCREECPVYRVTRYETFSCRGKMLVARGLVEGLLEPSKEMADMLDKCLLCGYCQSRCALKNMEIITSMRHHLAAKGLAAAVHQENVTKIVRDGRLFEPQVVAKREGECSFLRRMPVSLKTQGTVNGLLRLGASGYSSRNRRGDMLRLHCRGHRVLRGF